MSAVVSSLPGIEFQPAERAAVVIVPKDDVRHAPPRIRPPRPVTEDERRRPPPRLPRRAASRSTRTRGASRDSDVFWKVVGRSVRTTAPLVAADLLALRLAGMVAQAVLMLLSPPAARLVGWAAPVALVPLMIGYWLGGLYAELWAHPVLVLRQIAHVNTVALLAVAAASAFRRRGWPSDAPRRGSRRPRWSRSPAPRPAGSAPGGAWWGYPTLIIGSTRGAGGVAKALLNAPVCGLRPVLLTDPTGECRSAMLPVVNETTALESILRCESIRHAVIYLPEASNAHLSATVDRYSGLVPHLLVLSDCSTLPALWSARATPAGSAASRCATACSSPSLRIVKRAARPGPDRRGDRA